MTYIEWFESHGKKHQNIMKKLTHLSDDEVIAYFKFENMVEKEPDFCYLYKEGERVLYSTCSIEAKEGTQFISDDAIHHDCSACKIPHHEAYIMKHFSRDWFSIMRKVKQKQV